MSVPQSPHGLVKGRRYVITYEATEPGTGPERGTGVYTYRGMTAWGKVMLADAGDVILRLPPGDITGVRAP